MDNSSQQSQPQVDQPLAQTNPSAGGSAPPVNPPNDLGEHTLVQFPNTNTAQPMTAAMTVQPVTPTEPQPQPKADHPLDEEVDHNAVQEEISSTKFKESAPMPVMTKNTEHIVPAEAPINLESSVEQAGVKEVSQMPQLTDDHKNAGIKEAKEAVPVAPIVNAVASNIKLPMDKQKVQSIVKGPAFLKKTSSSMVWLAYLILKNYQYLEKKEKEEKNKK